MRLPRAIETPRLRLRPPTEDDLEPLFVLYSDPEVVRYLSFRPLRERGQVRAMLERFVRAWRQGEGDLTLAGRSSR